VNFEEISARAFCIFVDECDGSRHEGQILGKDDSDEEEFVWALVHDLKAVFQFHPSNAAVDGNGVIVFRTYDRKMSREKVLAQRPGDGTAPMFDFAKDPADMLRLVKTFALLLP